MKLEARDGDNGDVLDTGTLKVIDNTVDQTTGTVKMKGSFPNANGQLWPGQFVNLRLYVDTLRNVVVVPTPAVQRGPDGAFVYVVKDDKVAMAKVATGRQTETVTVLTAGLAPPADVVTTGFTRLTDGAKVSVSRPAPAGDRPAPAGDKPASESDRPAPAGDKPASESDRPARTSDAPVPAGGAEASAGEAKPAAEGGDGTDTAKDAIAPKNHRHRRDGAQAGATN